MTKKEFDTANFSKNTVAIFKGRECPIVRVDFFCGELDIEFFSDVPTVSYEDIEIKDLNQSFLKSDMIAFAGFCKLNDSGGYAYKCRENDLVLWQKLIGSNKNV